MEEIEELDKLINDIRKIEEEAERIGAIDLTGILKNKNLGSTDGVVQKLLVLRDELSRTIRSLGQLRRAAISQRIEVEQESPLHM